MTEQEPRKTELPTCWKIWDVDKHYEATDTWGNKCVIIGQCDIVANFQGYDIGGELVVIDEEGNISGRHPESIKKEGLSVQDPENR